MDACIHGDGASEMIRLVKRKNQTEAQQPRVRFGKEEQGSGAHDGFE